MTRVTAPIRILCCLCLCSLATLAVGASGGAQSGRKLPSNNSQRDQDQPLRLRADEVLLNVTVVDPYGHQTTDLNREDFIVAEDGNRQDIVSFAISSVPINVVLLLDASGSIVTEINSLRDAAMHFVNQLSPEDKTSVIEFHTNIELIQDWTSKADEVRLALSWRFKPGMVMNKQGRFDYGQTALYDALFSTADEQLSKVEGRKAIILLTDGDDTSSKLTYEQALGQVIKSGATVYVVSKARAFMQALSRYREYVERLEHAEQLMTDVAHRTGGQIYSPLRDEEMKAVYAQVARELKNQYIITYVSRNEARDGRLRHISVYLTRPGYTSRTRDSYYAPKEDSR